MVRGRLFPEGELPRTRLELRWSKVDETDERGTWNYRCDYQLVLELDQWDMRGEVYDDDGNLVRRERQKVLTLGGCRSDRSRSPLDLGIREIDTPFRDGAHIQWDHLALGKAVPMFVVAEGWAMQLFLSDAEKRWELREGETGG